MTLAILFVIATTIVLAALVVEWRRLERVRAQRAHLARMRAMTPIDPARVAAFQRAHAQAFARVAVTFRDELTPTMRRAGEQVSKLNRQLATKQVRRRSVCIGDRYVPRHRA